MDADGFTTKLEEAAAEMAGILKAQGADRPDWDPLHRVLPYEECAGFMFMGYSGEIRLYKHGFTRHYLNIDPRGRTYWYDERLASYFRVSKGLAIDWVFEGLEECGVDRTTAYDAEARRKRHEAMKKAGWTTLSVTSAGVTKHAPGT